MRKSTEFVLTLVILVLFVTLFLRLGFGWTSGILAGIATAFVIPKIEGG